ncbi:hypothetical protein FIBSPDRAFT_313104 [Athelia psychrophila]|uniref:Uncharacterized protein n=1 Tax=Athelia psychrophila TaxID=1759441 RepID=A0A166WET7_9AGAM|nr:hypothetical protein FIBSPDRAFT_313104 [Fibularhizoctonia sp. CBS 109695]
MIRKRTTFKFASESEDAEDEQHILDEQEQDELIEKLKLQSRTQDKVYLYVIQAVIALSGFLHVIYLKSHTNPLLALFPISQADTPLRPTSLTILAIFIHLNLSLLTYPNHLSPINITPLPYVYLFGLCAVAPGLSLLLGRGWLTIAWWSVTGGVVWLAHTVHQTTQRREESIARLEGLRYVAPGA